MLVDVLMKRVGASFRNITTTDRTFLFDPSGPAQAEWVEAMLADSKKFTYMKTMLSFFDEDENRRGLNVIGPIYPLRQHASNLRPLRNGAAEKKSREKQVRILFNSKII